MGCEGEEWEVTCVGVRVKSESEEGGEGEEQR